MEVKRENLDNRKKNKLNREYCRGFRSWEKIYLNLLGKVEYRKLQRCTRMCTVYMGNMGERGYRPKSCWEKTMKKGKRRDKKMLKRRTYKR